MSKAYKTIRRRIWAKKKTFANRHVRAFFFWCSFVDFKLRRFEADQEADETSNQKRKLTGKKSANLEANSTINKEHKKINCCESDNEAIPVSVWRMNIKDEWFRRLSCADRKILLCSQAICADLSWQNILCAIVHSKQWRLTLTGMGMKPL